MALEGSWAVEEIYSHLGLEGLQWKGEEALMRDCNISLQGLLHMGPD